ncbi:DUF4194 domain-containing protein [Sediminivirga luteola]|uniref:DUF4194 domain-containing protein n=1 Tax=Sediminivirga luteola TaxID=1774748 RepID=UPI001F5AEC4C|nr:DUF4194 domain-containing protein [Sediminivirga luteola]MCI2266160.1 DUF4194 domain-containing protein [Sediminivirga luteola]
MTEPTSAEAAPAEKLWASDTGTLREPSRRAMAALIKGPYVSAQRQPQNWRTLLGDVEAIRSRLADIFLELVVDDERGVAFVRSAQTYDEDAPQVVRTAPLTLMDTALLLHLRRELVSSSGAGRVMVGKDEVYEHLQTYRGQESTDDAGFTKRINASWRKMEQHGLLLRTPTSATDGRFEISPVLRLIFGPEQIEAVRAEYAQMRGEHTPDADALPPVKDDENEAEEDLEEVLDE